MICSPGRECALRGTGWRVQALGLGGKNKGGRSIRSFVLRDLHTWWHGDEGVPHLLTGKDGASFLQGGGTCHYPDIGTCGGLLA